MQPNREQDERITRYLLGDLPNSEQSAIEDEYFSDPDRFEAVWAVENDLVDRYVRGRLSDREHALFERHYLKSPNHQERIAFARKLLKAADEGIKEGPRASYVPTGDVATTTIPSWRSRLRETLHNSQVLSVGSMSMALLLAIGAGWQWIGRERLKAQLAQIQIEEKALREREEELNLQLATQREQNGKLMSELEQLRSARQQDRHLAQSPTQPAGRRSIFSFILSPMLMRSGREPQQLTIPRETDLLHLQMKVEQGDSRSLQAAIRTVEGKNILTLPARKRDTNKGRETIAAIDVPADKLPTGDYLLTLTAKSNGETEEMNRYFFRIIRK